METSQGKCLLYFSAGISPFSAFISGSTVMKIGGCKDPSDVPQEIDVALDLEYNGGFLIAIEVDLLFGKSAYLAVKLAHLAGRGRLQFSRQPCTHWSFAFYEVCNANTRLSLVCA